MDENKDVLILRNEEIKNTVGRRTIASAEDAYRHLGGLGKVPYGVLSAISHKEYRHSFDWTPNDVGYLRHLKDGIEVDFRDGIMYIGNKPASTLETIDVFTREHVDIDQPLVMALFSVILENLVDEVNSIVPKMLSQKEFDAIQSNGHAYDFVKDYFKALRDYSVRIYFPDLMKGFGYQNCNARNQEELRNKIRNLNRVIALSKYSIYQYKFTEDLQLLPWRFDYENNVITLQSPYINQIIYAMWSDTHYTVMEEIKKNIRVQRKVELPFVTTLMKPSILQAKNKRAYEVIYQLCLLMADAGVANNPNISVEVLISRCLDLRVSLELAKHRKERNQILNRTFTAVWKYITKYTHIDEYFTYKPFVPTDCRDDMKHVLLFRRKKAINKIEVLLEEKVENTEVKQGEDVEDSSEEIIRRSEACNGQSEADKRQSAPTLGEVKPTLGEVKPNRL